MVETVSGDIQVSDQAVVGKEVSNTGTWRDALTNDLKNHELIKNYQKPSEAIQDYIKVKGELAQAVKLPGEKATDDEKNAFYEKIGYPKDGKYGLQRPESISEEQFDPTILSEFEKVSGSLRLSKAQAEGLFNWYNKASSDRLGGIAAATKEAGDALLASLKQEWPGDSFDKNVNIAARAFREIGSGELGKSFEEFVNTKVVDGLKLGNHPLFLKYFHALGKAVLEDSGSVKRDESFGHGGIDDNDAIARKMFPSMVAKMK